MNDQTNPATGLHDVLNHERSEGAISGDHPQRPHPATRMADPLVRAESPDSTQPRKSSKPRPAAASNPEHREGVSPASPSPTSSPGPRTPAGKARSSQNAVKHGLRAKKLENAVAPELRSAYEKLRKQYLDEYRPSGAIESTLLDMVIFAAWQLYKIREMELFSDLDLGAPGSFGRSEKLARYRGSHERLLFRSLNQLKQIQQERLLRETDAQAALPAHIPPAVKLKPLFTHLKFLSKHPKTHAASVAAANSGDRTREDRLSAHSSRLNLKR